jgi:uncharacterized membrane protein
MVFLKAKNKRKSNLIDFMTSYRWYAITLFLITFAALAITLIPEDALPIAYLRSSLAILLILFLPGYSLMKAFFPSEIANKNTRASVSPIEFVVLSIGLSTALTAFVGLVLNYTSWGVRLTPITFNLTALTIILATAGMLREYRIRQSNRDIALMR